tara:strand:- start:13 stop:186 length:174 start_codon:yes stop_codon:yes gene_type:complete
MAEDLEVFLIPEPVTTVLEDGSIRIDLGEHSMIVSSFHLIQPKINLLTKKWLEKHAG